MNLLKIMKQYLEIRTLSGYDLQNTKYILKNFLLFLESKKIKHITTQIALEFATQDHACIPYVCSRKLRAISRFAHYLKRFDSKTEIPPMDLLPNTYYRRTPHIYTKTEIIRLLIAFRDQKSQQSQHPLKPLTYYTLFGLIAVTGMRIGEPLALERDCVDLESQIITIRESKFKKSRIIPIHPSTCKILKEYIKMRDIYFKKQMSPYFFVNSVGKRLDMSTVEKKFRNTCTEIGLRSKGISGPLIIDFRHTVAVNTLIRCYRKGLDPSVVIPILSTYLGHVYPGTTYWYLTATPELLKVINNLRTKKRGIK